MARVAHGHGIAAIMFGIIEILLGTVISICCFVVGEKVGNGMTTPYWAGMAYLVPGILGVVTGYTKNVGCMIAFMVVNIVALIILGSGAAVVLLYMSEVAEVLSAVSNHCITISNTCLCSYAGFGHSFSGTCAILDGMVVLLWAVVICCLLSAVVAFASSILGCASACCTPAEPIGFVMREQMPAGFQPENPGPGAAAFPPQYQPEISKNVVI